MHYDERGSVSLHRGLGALPPVHGVPGPRATAFFHFSNSFDTWSSITEIQEISF